MRNEDHVRVAISCILQHRMGQTDGYEPGNDIESCHFGKLQICITVGVPGIPYKYLHVLFVYDGN